MGSLRFDGVLFQIFSADHPPRHAHGRYAESVVIVEFWRGGACLANRRDALTPRNAKRNDVMKVVKAAQEHQAELYRLWEEIHGSR
jgi:hypothetical protein